jgi:hypothetical protein
MSAETQAHPLANGKTLNISRDGNHHYWIDGGDKVRSVTGMVQHVEGDSFGSGMGWAIKVIRESGGDTNAPRKRTQESQEAGTTLHATIEAYIKHGTITEDNPLFLSWFKQGQSTGWIPQASERFVYHPGMLYGGTLDAMSVSSSGCLAIWDFKTVESGSWHKYGDSLRRNKDWAQLAAYAEALRAMNSVWIPMHGYITYVLRDGSATITVEADLKRGLQLFKASRELFLLTEGDQE